MEIMAFAVGSAGDLEDPLEFGYSCLTPSRYANENALEGDDEARCCLTILDGL
jgi:hypothetical protein